MHGALPTLGCLLALMASASAFVVPGPSKIVSGRSTRATTSQVVVMGRGDTRTTKGKRMRHSFGNCRPQKKKVVEYFEGEVVVKQAPVARRWENIEYVESELFPQSAADSSAQPEAAEEQAVDIEAAVAEVSSPDVAVEAPAEVESAVEVEAEAEAVVEAEAEAVAEEPAAEA